MLKFGPTPAETRAMSIGDIFLARLKLLIIMAKAYLKNYPIGNYRKSAIIENAHHVFYHSLQCFSGTNFSEKNESEHRLGITFDMDIEDEREFHQRIRLLAVMVKALAEGRLKGDFRKKELQENLDGICNTLLLSFHIKDFEFFKVA